MPLYLFSDYLNCVVCISIKGILKGKRKHSLKRKSKNQKPDTDVAEFLELSEWECKTTMIIDLMEKLDKLEEKMCNVSRHRNSKEKSNHKEML